MTLPSPAYASFLIRLWREPPTSLAPQAAGSEWLVQVEHISSGTKEYFASLEALFAFLQAQLPGPADESPPGSRSDAHTEFPGGIQ